MMEFKYLIINRHTAQIVRVVRYSDFDLNAVLNNIIHLIDLETYKEYKDGDWIEIDRIPIP